MLNYNQRLNVIFNDAEILTARNHNAFNGLDKIQLPQNETEQAKIDKLKQLKTYTEIKATKTKTPYKLYMLQF